MNCALMSRTVAKTSPTVLWVSPTGSDAAAGTYGAPLRTLGGAKAKFAALTATQKAYGCRAIFKSGTYPVTSKVTFSGADNGLPWAPIVYEAETPGGAVFDGGTALTGWAALTSGDAAAWAAIPASARSHVHVCDLNALGIDASLCGTINKRGVEDSLQSVAGEAFLVCDGAMMTLAQYPNEGTWLTIPATDAAAPIEITPSGADGARFAAYAYDTAVAWFGGYPNQNYNYSRVGISAISNSTGKITLTTVPIGSQVTSGYRYRIINVLEELDVPGEFYIDRTTLKLYFYPPVGITTAMLETKCKLATMATDFVYNNGASNLTFKGFTIQNGRYNGVDERGTNTTWQNCTFQNLGAYAVKGLFCNGHNVTVDGCTMRQLGAGGVRIASPAANYLTLQSTEHIISNNTLSDYSRLDRTHSWGFDVRGVGTTVAHNAVSGSSYGAVRLEGNDHQITWNDIDGVCTEMSDMGAIYIGRQLQWRGNVISHNLIQNVVDNVAAVYPETHAIYLDDRISGVTVSSNVVISCDHAVYNAGGRENLIHNNVASGCYQAMRLGNRATNGDLAARTAEMTAVMGSPVGSAPDQMYDSRPYSKYAHLLDILLGPGTSNPLGDQTTLWPRRTQILNNVETGCAHADTATGDAWLGTAPNDATVAGSYSDTCNYSRPAATHYSGASPGFVNFPTSLATTPGGNAATVGFVEWDVSLVGPQ